MVDEIQHASLQSLLQRYGNTRLDSNRDISGQVVDTTTEDNEETPFKRAARIVRQLNNRVGHVQWNQHWVQQLQQAAEQSIQDAVKTVRHLNNLDEYAMMSAANAVRAQIRKLIESLDPPPEVIDSEEFQELLAMLWPQTSKKGRDKGNFSKNSGMRGSIKQEVKMQQLHEAIQKAVQQAQQRMRAAGGKTRGGSEQFLAMDLEQMARFLRRKMRESKKKRGIKDPNKITSTDGVEDPEELEEIRELQSMMEMFSATALETMQVIREIIAPTWAPETQPWLIGNADQHVYSIILATIPEELFAQTEAYDAIQDLRKQQAVFTLRAADKLTEAAARHIPS